MQQSDRSKRGARPYGRDYGLRIRAVRRKPLDARRLAKVIVEQAVDAVAEQMRQAGKSEAEIETFRQLSWLPTQVREEPLTKPRRRRKS